VTGYLLDTHALLWWVDDDRRLSAEVRETIVGAERVVASDVSLWELVVTCGIGKLDLDPDAWRWFEDHASASRFGALAISRPHLRQVTSLPLHHRDPFDRLLIAQAIVEDLTIITADAAFDAYEVGRTW
jgi:PIN domain nuclease of toxin-antitoxin system